MLQNLATFLVGIITLGLCGAAVYYIGLYAVGALVLAALWGGIKAANL